MRNDALEVIKTRGRPGLSNKDTPIGGDPYKTLELTLECASQLSGLCNQLILTAKRCALVTCKHNIGYDD